MITSSYLRAGAIVLFLSSTAMAADSNPSKVDHAKAQADTILLDEVWFVPLRFESVEELSAASYHYRRNEERAAANEINKAVSWLKYAESHAYPITKEKLSTAVEELSQLSQDLRDGNSIAAADLDKSMASAAQALAEWHYYKAKEHFGRDEAEYAAQDLEAAAAHLQYAANSAHFEYGPDTVTVFDDVYRDGKMVSHNQTVDHNRLGMHLESIEKAVKEMGKTLEKTS